MSRIVFSRAARLDRSEITAYTAERFGPAQARQLRDRFQLALTSLAHSPHLGRTSPILDPPGRSFRYFLLIQRFIIVYEPTEYGIRVVRLLHGARNLVEEVDHDPGDDG